MHHNVPWNTASLLSRRAKDRSTYLIGVKSGQQVYLGIMNDDATQLLARETCLKDGHKRNIIVS